MKKIIIFSSIILITIILGIALMIGCKKENVIVNNEEITKLTWENYEACIGELMSKTGIDIYALSKFKEIKNISLNYKQIDATLSSKVEISDAIVVQIQQLRNAMEIAAANEDYDTFFTLFEQLYTLTASINGIAFTTNEDGLQIIQYNDNDYLFPVAQLEANEITAKKAIRAVTDAYPTFSALPEDAQQDILASALYLNFMEDENNNPSFLPSGCSAARAALVTRLTAYTVAYTLSAGLCGGTWVAIFICEGLAYAMYMEGCTSAINAYKATGC